MERSRLTTLCYIEREGEWLMLHRVSKQHDVNKDKWIGIGGHFEEGESPEECLLREAREETGLLLTSWRFRGIVTFSAEGWDTEYMCLYTADAFQGELTSCDEGELEWVKKEEVLKLRLWEGDNIFFRLMNENAPFFSLKLSYRGDRLTEAVLDGTRLELLELLDAEGNPTGIVRERTLVHQNGDRHGTAHIWVARKSKTGWDILLQKRSQGKDSYPGCYDISAAGHVQAGDGFLESALRELKEELGITAKPEELTFAGFHSGYMEDVFYGKPFRDRELSAVYLYQEPVQIETLRLQREEVEAVRWMDLEESMAHVRKGDLPNCIYLDELELVKSGLRKFIKL